MTSTRTLLLAGAAALGFAAAATPGTAQYAGNPPQVSTPAEKAETQQLNEQATQGTSASPQSLNGEGGNPNEPSAVNRERAAEQAQYQDQQQQYQADQERYRDQRERYERDIHRYDEARFAFDYPRAYPYRYEDGRLSALYLIAEPSQQLANAPVEGPNGEWVGRVRNVEIADDGRPSRVQIALNHRVAVWVRPGDLKFDADDHILFTDLTRTDLWNMPGSPTEM